MLENNGFLAKVERLARTIRITAREMAGMIDHALLRPEKSSEAFVSLCNEAKKYNFFSVCVNPCWVKFCSNLLKSTGIKIVSVVSFPFGQATPMMKATEAMEAVENGAAEVDMVMNIGAFKGGDYGLVRRDIEAVVKAVGKKTTKVIIESGFLTDNEIIHACEIVKQTGAHFVKTATGFGPTGATIRHIHLMRNAVGQNFGVKASGGIKSYSDALNMIAAGANRIGSSHSVRIIEDCILAEAVSKNPF